MKMIIFFILFLGFRLLFARLRMLERGMEMLRKTWWDMDAAARQRTLENRRKLVYLQREHTIWTALERELNYSGLKLRFPGLTAEFCIAGNLAAMAFSAVLLSALWGAGAGAVGVLVLAAGEYLALHWLRAANMRAVNEHLMKLLDFLGNYSMTAGEVTGVFHQISRYMEDPIKSVLDSCYYEAQTTGDAGLALISMAEKIEHPKFKELARNKEISIRYCADFSALVAGSRRSLREYLRISQERKSLMREAMINMALLLGMSLMVLFSVGYLVQMSVAELLTGTLPGRAGLGVLALIAFLFTAQMRKSS